MVAERESLVKAALRLVELIEEGGSILPAHRQMADRLKKLCNSRGAYTKQYEDHEERVLMRHLNLYKNKLAKARSDTDKRTWEIKVLSQMGKISAWRAGRDGQNPDLDLDGL